MGRSSRRSEVVGLLIAALSLVFVGCASDGATATPANALRVMNDALGPVVVSVWSGDAIPKDPQEPVKAEAAVTRTIPEGESWVVELAQWTGGGGAGASSVVATAAVYGAGQDLGAAQWIDVEGQRPWTIRVFGQVPNLRVMRVYAATDPGRMQRTVGPRPPPVGTTGGLVSPQR